MLMLSIGGLLRHLPPSLTARLDAWSQRIASERALARRQRGQRKTQPLPPVLNGRPYLPHPWRD